MKRALFVVVAIASEIVLAGGLRAQAPGRRNSAPATKIAPATTPARATAQARSERATYPGASPGTSANFDAERTRLWNSLEMQEARTWVVDRARLSRRTNPQDAQQYLSRVQQMSPGGMRAWLDRVTALRENTLRGVAIEKLARQAQVEQSLGRQQQVAESYRNFNLNQEFAALTARDRLLQQQQQATGAARLLQAERGVLASRVNQVDYRDFWDPPLYTRQAASASLPGDLPRGDPLNFIRGDVLVNDRTGAIEAAGLQQGAHTVVTPVAAAPSEQK